MYLTNPAENSLACPGILHRYWLFYSIYFPISKILCGCGGSCAIVEWACCIPTFVIVIRMRLQQDTIISPNIPCWKWKVKHWGSAGMITLEELAWNWQQWQIKSITMSWLSIQKTEWMESLFVSVSTFSAFHPSSKSDASSLSTTGSQQNVVMHSSLKAVKLGFESLLGNYTWKY